MLLLNSFTERNVFGSSAEAAAITPVTAQPQGTNSAPARIGPDVVWGPGMSVMQEIKAKCGAQTAQNINVCFANAIRKAGAAAQAAEFARKIGEAGYARDFRALGPVDIAYVHYPFRANENQGAMLLNGAPELINIDDQSLLAQDEMKKNPTYARLAQKHSEVTLWPGERNGTDYITTKTLPGGGQRVIVGYRLRNGCHACEVIGAVNFAFDFDRAGNLLGTKLISVVTATNNQ